MSQFLDLSEQHAALDVPILNLGEYTGMTGYLDFIQTEEMTAPVMKGVDAAGRPFIALFTVVTIDEEKERDEAVLVLHLRYKPQTKGYNPWVEAGSMGCQLMQFDRPEEALEKFERLLAGEPVYDGDCCTYHLVESV